MRWSSPKAPGRLRRPEPARGGQPASPLLICPVGSEVGKNQWSRINALLSKGWLPISTQTVLAGSIQSKPFPNMTEEGLSADVSLQSLERKNARLGPHGEPVNAA